MSKLPEIGINGLKYFPILILAIFSFSAAPSYSQFILFSMEVEPEIQATSVRDLNFGVRSLEEGTVYIGLGDQGMGIFQIRGLADQLLLVDLDFPGFLEHPDPLVKDRAPVDIQAAYSNLGENNPDQAVPFGNSTVSFTILNIRESPPSDEIEDWSSAYIYLYGNLTIPDIEPGTYRGTIVLTIDKL